MIRMEENLPWRIVFIAALFSLAILGVAYFFISPRESTYFNSEKTEKIAEYKNTRIEGRKEGKIIWEFYAREGWTTKGQETTHLLRVKNGRIYKNGQPTVADLSSPQAKVYLYSDIVEAFNSAGQEKLRARIDLGKFSTVSKDKSKWAAMSADFIRYIPAQKRSEMTGDITLSLKDFSIRADRINIDHEKKIASMPEKVIVTRRDGILQAEAAEYWGELEQMNASGRVNFSLKEGRVKTRIKCNQATLFVDTFKDITLSGSLEVTQGKKLAVAEEGTYSRLQKGLLLKGKTRTVLEKGRALLNEKSVSNLQNPDVKNILKDKTVIKSSEIFFSTKTSDARATGSVEVTQKGREARSDSAYYNDRNELLVLTGNVFLKKGKDWIACRQVTISVRRETLEAAGVKEARFKL
jgi:lipopolysaccharide export system protein LptA